MKKIKKKNPYVRISIFEIILIIVLIINSFVFNFLNSYYMLSFLGVLFLIFHYYLGFEKDRHRHTKDVIMNIIIYLLTFFILYYLSGLILSFARNAGYYSYEGFVKFTLRIAVYVVLRELLRYQVLNKCEGSAFSNVLAIVLFILFDVTNIVANYTFADKYKTFVFFAVYLLPIIGNNLLATYLTKKTGYKPVIFYMLIMELYTYVLPIYPNPDKYIASVIGFSVPMIFLYKQYSFFAKESDEDIPRNYNRSGMPWLVLSLFVTVVLVYFSSGYFHYHAMAVGSGSMNPVIQKGDVVVIEKIEDNNYSIIKVGDVIAFNFGNTVVVHRIIKIIENKGQYFFYTKGDANKDADNFVVENNMIKGIVKYKIPIIGYPTVWINRL